MPTNHQESVQKAVENRIAGREFAAAVLDVAWMGVQLRVVQEDGIGREVTTDYVPMRANIIVEHGRITAVDHWG